MDKTLAEGRKKALESGRAVHNNMLESSVATNVPEVMRLIKIGYTRAEEKEHLPIKALTTMESNGFDTGKRCYAGHRIGSNFQQKHYGRLQHGIPSIYPSATIICPDIRRDFFLK